MWNNFPQRGNSLVFISGNATLFVITSYYVTPTGLWIKSIVCYNHDVPQGLKNTISSIYLG